MMPSRKPRVCFVAPHAYPVLSGNESHELIGGAEVQQAIVARGLAARGYAVSMICLDFGQDEIVDIDGIRVYRAYRPEAGIPILRFLWPRLTSLWSCMKRAEADIYYQRTANRITGLVAAYCRLFDKKSIFAASGNPNFDRNTRRIGSRGYRWLYEYGLMHVDQILAQNAEQVDLCLKNFGRQSILVPNCYEGPSTVSPAAGRDILWVGTIRNLKRPHKFLDLAAALPQFEFTMVGGPAADERGTFATIKARAESLSNVRFVGFVPYSQIDRYFDAAALLINTSESEGFPNTFLQAWSRGILSLSYIDSGARLGDRPVGRMLGSARQMASTIAEFMGDDLLRFREGSLCRQYFKAHHAPSRVLDLYEKIFSGLVEK